MAKVEIEKLSLFGDRVLILADAEEERTASGLYLPKKDKDAEPPRTGTVKAIGDEVETLEVGDRVMFGKYAGQDFEETLGDKNLLIMRAPDVIGLIKD